MAKAEGLKLAFDSEDKIRPELLETFDFDSPDQYILTETDEFSAVCPFSGLPDLAYVKIEYFPRVPCEFYLRRQTQVLNLLPVP